MDNLANPAAPQANPNTTIPSRLKINDPDVWSGTRSTLPKFLASCRVKFMIEKHNFPDEFSKIGYAGSYLGGSPQDWWLTLFQRYENALYNGDIPPAELSSFSLFSQALTTSYGDPDLTGTMERKLRTLRQTASVADYAAEFQRIAGFLTTAGWSDRPLLSHYRFNLKDNIKKVLVHEKPFPTTLLEMIAASIRIDNCEQEMVLDCKADTLLFEPQSRELQSRELQSPTYQAVPHQPAIVPSSQPNSLATSTNGYAQE